MPATSPRISQRSRTRKKSSRRQRFFAEYRQTRLWGELLEPRLMMAVDTPDIVVGRILSAYSIADVQNNELKITYTVYNQEAEDVSGVLLTSTLQPGVSLVDAAQLPDQNGQELAWSLGTIPAFGRASVEVTVELANNTILTIDDGAEAFSTLSARASSDQAPVAALDANPISAALLASTIDANTTDPFIQEQAARLDYDPQNIIDFLQDEIGYESYVGSLRGARGTLWSSAGNALDEASLGVALFRASGIPARYAHGTLSDPLAQQLILSMFPDSFQTVGYIPAGIAVADPVNAPQLLAETRSHYWVQFDTGSGFQNIDTTFASAALGQTFAMTAGTFNEVVDSLRHKVTVRLDVESLSQASAALTFGNGLSTATVLEHEFISAALVGRPLTLGFFVSLTDIPSPTLRSRTFTFAPYLQEGDIAFDPINDHLIRGQDFQEVQTNLALGNRLVTRAALQIDLSAPGGTTESLERVLIDRIGFAARHGGGASVTFDPDGPPVITPTDFWTIGIAAAEEDSRAAASAGGSRLLAEYEALHDAVAADDTPTAVAAFQRILVGQTRAYLAGLHLESSFSYRRLAQTMLVASYFDSPRVTVLSGRIIDAGNDTAALEYEADLLRDLPRVVVAPGQAADTSVPFLAARGVLESVIEADIFPAMPDGEGPLVARQGGAATVFEAAQEQGIAVLTLAPDQIGQVETLAVSAEAKARITAALQSGRTVVVPATSVLIGGEPATAWYEIDLTTGETVGMGENGTHQGVVTYAAAGAALGVLAVGGLYSQLIPFAEELAEQQGHVAFALFALRYLPSTDEFNSLTERGKIIRLREALEVTRKCVLISDVSILPPVALIQRQAFDRAVNESYRRFARLTGDPPVPEMLIASPDSLFPSDQAAASPIVTAVAPSGTVSGTLAAASVRVAGSLQATWDGVATNAFRAGNVMASSATVRNVGGATVGTGTFALTATTPIAVSVSGTNHYQITGVGSLSFYGPASPGLGASGEWAAYTATIDGTVSLTLTAAAGATLNGVALPPGEYTITTNSASLSGSGPSSSPDFSASATVTATDATLNIGPASGAVTLGGSPLDLSSGGTLTGYSGTIGVTAGPVSDAIALAGSATNALSLSVSPAAVAVEQNATTTFQVNLNSTLAGEYNLATDGPSEWLVTADDDGLVTVTPAPGVRGGTFPIRILVMSATNGDLVAQASALVTVTASAPALTLTVSPDTALTVGNADDAQSPTAFLAAVQNTGPTTETVQLSFANIPAGFDPLISRTTLTVSPGTTGEIGFYLRASDGVALPAPGTPLSFDLTATSTADPLRTQTRTVSFVMPDVHGLRVTPDRTTVGTTPGTPEAFTVTLTAVGNVPETVNLSATTSAGLALGGLPPTVTLQPGQTLNLALTLTPAVAAALGSTLTTTITARFNPLGEDFDKTVIANVRVVAPGADAAATAAGSANQTGNTDLANRLSELATGITNLFLTTDSAVFKSQVLAALDAVAGLVAADYFLAPLVPAPVAARAALVAAVTQTEIRDALTLVGDYLEVLEPQLLAVARHGFTFVLDRTAAVIQTNVPTHIQVFMQNLGTQTTTYELTASSAASVRYVRNGATITSVTLQPGQVIVGGADGVSLEILSDTSNTLPLTFTATARAALATQLARTVAGSATFRPDFLRIASVIADPPFTNAGPTVGITARLYNGLNTSQDILASYIVRAPGGAVVFTSPTVAFTLPAQGANLASLALAAFNTTGLANGEYVVDVTLTDTAGAALPGGTGSGRVRVGLPVSASLVSTVEILSPGNQSTRSSTQSLTLSGIVPLADPFTLIGQATTSGNSNSLAIIGNLAYVAGSEAVDIVDISNPANPVLVGSFAQGFVPPSGYSIVRDLPGDRIAVLSSISLNATGFDLRVYDVSNPLVPTLVSDTTIDQQFPADFQAVGNTALVSTTAESFLGNVYVGPLGDLVSVDLAAAGGPTITDRLFNTGTPSTGGPHQFGIELVDADTAYVASFTTSPALAGRRVGRLLVVDYSDPANLVLTRQVEIPATFKLYDVAISGNTALVVGTDNNDAGGVTTRFNTGHLTLITLDITDRDNPVVVSTEVTTATFPTDQGRLAYPSVVPVGGGKFAVSNTLVDGEPVILLVDASNPLDIRTAALEIDSVVDEITVAGGNLYATSDDGLLVFDIGNVESIPLTASVQVPAGRAHTFNIAPDRITTAAGVDTLEWDRVLGAGISNQLITWVQNVPMSPGLFADITFGGTVAFTSQGTPGTITLPGTGVGTLGTFVIDPELRTVRPGETAEFTVTINDPDGGNAVYGFVVTGIPAAWANFPASIQANAQGQATFILRLTPDANANLDDYGFVIHGGNGFNAVGFAGGTLRVAGVPVNAPDPESRAVVAQFTTPVAAAGQGTSARYTVRVTNTGSVTDTFALAVSNLPPGVMAVLEQTTIEVPPGASNFRDVSFVVTAAMGTPPANITLALTATSLSTVGVSSRAEATLNILAQGVNVSLDREQGLPGESFQMTVTNTGTISETFDLSAMGPAGIVATLEFNQLTLAPAESRVVNVSTAAVDFAVPGLLNFIVAARSRTAATVVDSDFANLLIQPATGLATSFDPAVKIIPVPGTADFILLVNNTGNVEDAYTATISGTTGPVIANLVDLNGQATQAIPIFRLPGLSTGAILLRTQLTGLGLGQINVQVRSLNNETIISQATASLETEIVISTDFGDAPDSYGTLLANDGARHTAIGPQLGLARDPEVDGQPAASALDDDQVGVPDDEDGVVLPGLLVAGTCDCSGTGLGSTIIVTASAAAYLDAWIDFNRDGDFDANERIAASMPVLAGANTLNVIIPDTVSNGPSYARFRISSAVGLGPTGPANDGEVEDYAVQLFNPSFGSGITIVDPSNTNSRVLYVKGTVNSDAIVVLPTWPGFVTVYIAPTLSIGTFSLASFDRIVICALAGHDAIVVAAPITKPTVIYGDEGHDSISGGSGPDIIFGGDGIDAIVGNSGDDTISGGDGIDTLVGGLGFDRLYERVSGVVTLTTTLLKIGAEVNPLVLFEAATLIGGTASDSFNLSGWSLPASVDGGGGTNTIVDAGNANFVLTEGSLVRTVGATVRTIALASIQNANLTGGISNNTFNLSGWPHAATLSGGAGTDLFTASGDGDFTLSDAMLLRPNQGMLRLSGFENATLTGSSSANTFNVSGWSQAATLNAGSGADKLIAAGNVNFTLSNTQLTRSTGGAFTLSGFESAELTGGTGNNTLSAATFTGQVKLDGGAGNDTLTSGSGIALLLGGAGNDTLRAGTGRSLMIGGLGLDRLTGGSNDDLLVDGTTAHDNNALALAMLLAEWASASSYADRLAHLTGTPGGLNGDTTHLGGSNVLHDTAIDILLGGLGEDLFFAKLDNPAKDTLSDKTASESAY